MNLKTIAERAVNGAPLLSELLNPERKQDLDTYLWGMEVVDFLIEHPSIKWTRQDFIDTLAKLVPRLYSISSSLKAQPDQVHFTIDVVHYESRGRMRKGVYSTFLAERAQKGKNWLFFGSQHQHCNYFYKEEFEQHGRDGFLT